MTGIVQDISRAKQAEEGHKMAVNRANQANLAKNSFLSMMSHEMRAPLTSMLGFAQVIQHKSSSNEVKKFAQLIEKGSRLLNQIVDDVMDLSRIESGTINFDIQDIDLQELVQDCCLFFGERIEREGLTLVHRREPSKLSVLSDPHRLRQVMINLISNAIKYNKPNGSIEISYYCTQDETITLTISDTGIGIDPENKNKIFEEFTRLSPSKNGQTIEGVGLGLVIVKKTGGNDE